MIIILQTLKGFTLVYYFFYNRPINRIVNLNGYKLMICVLYVNDSVKCIVDQID